MEQKIKDSYEGRRQGIAKEDIDYSKSVSMFNDEVRKLVNKLDLQYIPYEKSPFMPQFTDLIDSEGEGFGSFRPIYLVYRAIFERKYS